MVTWIRPAVNSLQLSTTPSHHSFPREARGAALDLVCARPLQATDDGRSAQVPGALGGALRQAPGQVQHAARRGGRLLPDHLVRGVLHGHCRLCECSPNEEQGLRILRRAALVRFRFPFICRSVGFSRS